MPCRFCDVGTGLIRAHVIPKGFFRVFREAAETPRLLTNNPSEYPRRIPAGIYDETILCEACEPRFGNWDQYAQELLRDDLPHAIVHRYEADVVGYEIDEWRYDLLKLFFVSLSWRASVSTQSMFHRIQLGPFEHVARTMLDQGKPGSAQDFAVFLRKFDPQRGHVILDPHRDRIDGINFVRFYLGVYVAYIKIDKRPAPAAFESFLLEPARPLKIIGRDIHGAELGVLRSIVQKRRN
jgi:hypothetical protein